MFIGLVVRATGMSTKRIACLNIYLPVHSSNIDHFPAFHNIEIPTQQQSYIQYEIDQYTGPIQPPAPLLAGALTGATYYMRAGPRVATLAGAIGMGCVGGTFAVYSLLGIPYGSKGWLFF